MGQHLHIYASREIPIEVARAIVTARAYDCVRVPTVEERTLMGPYATQIDYAAHFEDGLRDGCSRFPELMDPQVVTPELIERLAADSRGGHIAEFLRDWVGAVIWCDNDGY